MLRESIDDWIKVPAYETYGSGTYDVSGVFSGLWQLLDRRVIELLAELIVGNPAGPAEVVDS